MARNSPKVKEADAWKPAVSIAWETHPFLRAIQKPLTKTFKTFNVGVLEPIRIEGLGTLSMERGPQMFRLFGEEGDPHLHLEILGYDGAVLHGSMEVPDEVPQAYRTELALQLVTTVLRFVDGGKVVARRPSIEYPAWDVIEVKDLFDLVVTRLSEQPHDIYAMPPRSFEELLAELLVKEGHSVELTKRTRDGGRDILAWHRTALGSHLVLIEAKRYAPDRLIGLEQVQRLEAVRATEPAGSAALVTTSAFSRPAMEWAASKAKLLELLDGRFLSEWLDKHNKSSK